MIHNVCLTKELLCTKSKLIDNDTLTLVFSAVFKENHFCSTLNTHFFIANEIITVIVNDARLFSFSHMSRHYFLSSPFLNVLKSASSIVLIKRLQ